MSFEMVLGRYFMFAEVKFFDYFSRRPKRLICLFFLGLVLAIGFSSHVLAQEGSCVICHDDIEAAAAKSIHTKAGISCQHCHGGDPAQDDEELAMSLEAGFVGVPNKLQIIETCGSCHQDVEAMNKYGIPTDQLARYKTSTHGKKIILEGSMKAAVCSDCHGHHNILAVIDPNSPVFPLNVPATCNKCHGNADVMKDSGHPTDIFETYKDSVHGKALFEKGDTSVANCVSCHGSHGAVPPGVRELSATCGKCHVNEKKFFNESIHASLVGQDQFSECIACHGYHGVQPVRSSLYIETCSSCHKAGTPAATQGKLFYKAFEDSDTRLRGAVDLVHAAGMQGVFVEEEMAKLEEVKTEVLRMAPEQHTLSLKKLESYQQRINAATQQITERIERKKRDLQRRKWFLIPLWIFVITMAMALWIKCERLKYWNKRRKELRGDDE